MNIAWTKHLKTEEEKERFKNILLGAKPVLDRLSTLFEEDEAGLNSAETSVKVYDLPNWDYRQADVNGYKRCLKIYKNLINLDQGTK